MLLKSPKSTIKIQNKKNQRLDKGVLIRNMCFNYDVPFGFSDYFCIQKSGLNLVVDDIDFVYNPQMCTVYRDIMVSALGRGSRAGPMLFPRILALLPSTRPQTRTQIHRQTRTLTRTLTRTQTRTQIHPQTRTRMRTTFEALSHLKSEARDPPLIALCGARARCRSLGGRPRGSPLDAIIVNT